MMIVNSRPNFSSPQVVFEGNKSKARNILMALGLSLVAACTTLDDPQLPMDEFHKTNKLEVADSISYVPNPKDTVITDSSAFRKIETPIVNVVELKAAKKTNVIATAVKTAKSVLRK